MSFFKRKSNIEYERKTTKKLKLTFSDGNSLNNFDIHRNMEETKVLNAFEKQVEQITNMENFYQLTKFRGKSLLKFVVF